MDYCCKCLSPLCRCGQRKIEIDYYIYPAVYEFNRKGYKTIGCCSGHENGSALSTYIWFEKDLGQDIKSDYIQFDTYNYNGAHVRKYLIKANPDLIKSFKKKRTPKLKMIQEINRELYRIAREIPDKEVNPAIETKEFPDEYFFDEFYSPDVPDIQQPWEIVLPNSSDCRKYVEDYFNTVSHWDNLFETIMNYGGADNIYRASSLNLDSRYADPRTGFKDKLFFDISSCPKLLQFGQERDLLLERELFHDCEWTLSYALISSDDRYFQNAPSSLDIMSDICDFMDEHSDEDTLTCFEYGFSLLMKKSVNICAFSSTQVMIIMSNKIDFGFHASRAGIAAIFGNVDYDEADHFKHVSVDNKELFIIIGDGILLRKELDHVS